MPPTPETVRSPAARARAECRLRASARGRELQGRGEGGEREAERARRQGARGLGDGGEARGRAARLGEAAEGELTQGGQGDRSGRRCCGNRRGESQGEPGEAARRAGSSARCRRNSSSYSSWAAGARTGTGGHGQAHRGRGRRTAVEAGGISFCARGGERTLSQEASLSRYAGEHATTRYGLIGSSHLLAAAGTSGPPPDVAACSVDAAK
mmetsp:Transcript_2714/g.5648  ORF Transcript_2714/g.5648 Transcript_2714/m.5648 type:complete len:210 (+) Transcript_2714:540-1169(+)